MRDLIAEVWGAMAVHEYYTPRDIANMLDISVEQTWRIMDFLIRYGFLDLVSGKGALVKKVPEMLPPQMALQILQQEMANVRIGRFS